MTSSPNFVDSDIRLFWNNYHKIPKSFSEQVVDFDLKVFSDT